MGLIINACLTSSNSICSDSKSETTSLMKATLLDYLVCKSFQYKIWYKCSKQKSFLPVLQITIGDIYVYVSVKELDFTMTCLKDWQIRWVLNFKTTIYWVDTS